MGTRKPRSRPSRLGLFDGFGAFFGGIGFVLATPSVWPFAAVPAGMAVLLGCGLTGLGFWGASRFSDALIADSGTFSTLGQWLLTIVLGVALMVVSVLLALALAQPLSGWALEAISRRQERALTGRVGPEPGLLEAMWLAARYSLFTATVGGMATVLLFAIAFVFPPAAVVTVPLKFLVVALLVAWNLIDYPLGLRGLGVRQRLRWVLQRQAPVVGFGLAWATVLLIPGIALLVLPMGVAGATRLVVADEELEEVRPA
jgi:CysZ protein